MSDDFYVPSSQRGVFFNGTAWVFGILALVVLVAVVIGGIRWASAPARGKLQAREQIQSGASRISGYNHFFDLCASVQGLEGQLAAQVAALTTAGSGDRGRVQANIAGIQGARAQAIAEYNADAAKSYTVGQFRSSKLPYQLSTTYEGSLTSCVAG